jgi:tetraacyldisaccharide-1-P 4'-kinase
MIIDNGKYSSAAPFGRSFPVRAASAAFGAAVGARNALYDHLPFLSHRANRPVISIGGLRAGGTGKTPVALMVGEYLLSKGRDVAFLSRGYRRKGHGLRIVKPNEKASWEETGDEPCLLHNRLLNHRRVYYDTFRSLGHPHTVPYKNRNYNKSGNN